MIEVRPLQAADAAAYQALRLVALRDHPAAFASSVEEEQDVPLDTVAQRLAPRDGAVVFGAFDGARLVGMVGVYRERLRKFAHKAHIWGMYVAPAARRQGAGRQLLDRAIAQAMQMSGVRQLTLGVNASNTAALTLYEGAGFMRFGIERGFLLVDGVLHDEIHMVRLLDLR